MFREIKLIIESEFNKEREKQRSTDVQNELGNALTAIEIEIQKKLKRLQNGESINTINPEMKPDKISYSPIDVNHD